MPPTDPRRSAERTVPADPLALAVLLLVILPSPCLEAQWGPGASHDVREPLPLLADADRMGLGLTTRWTVRAGRLTGRLSGSLHQIVTRGLSATAHSEWSSRPVPAGPVLISARVDGLVRRLSGGTRVGSVQAGPTLLVPVAGSLHALWLRAGWSRGPGGAGPVGRGGVEVEGRVGGVLVRGTASATRYRSLLAGPGSSRGDSGSPADTARGALPGDVSPWRSYGDVSVQALVRLQGVPLRTELGVRLLPDGEVGSWGRMGAAFPVSDHVTLDVEVSRLAAAPELRLEARNSIQAALRLSWPRGGGDEGDAGVPVGAPILDPTDEGATVRLSFTHPAAHTVEVAADFTDWEPVHLREVRPGRWSLDRPLTPGLYRLNVRVDGGAWTVPEGVPVVQDGILGPTGVLLVG